MSCQTQQEQPSTSTEHSAMTTTDFYVGTYTNGDSKGIYKLSLTSDGKASVKGLAAQSSNPSYLTKSADQKYLLAVNENDEETYQGGSVESFRIVGDDLILINRQASGGAHPCYITANAKGEVLTANYTGGSLGLLRLQENGELTKLLNIEQHTGKGSTDRQKAPHAHMARFIPNSNDIVSVDLGTNELWFSQINSENQKLETASHPKIKMNEGAGPRHLDIHPSGQWIYVINELDNTITLLTKNEAGQYKKGKSFSTLPSSFTEESFCADIHISKDGKFLYASNRGHNSIATFSIDSNTGELTALAHTDVHGKWPRNFAFSPEQDFLLVANQHSNNIVTFKRDQQSGLIEFVGEIEVPAPVCILF